MCVCVCRQFLYGDPDCPPEDQQMNLKTSEILNPSSSFQAPNTQQEVPDGKTRATKNISFDITGIGLKVKAGKKVRSAALHRGTTHTHMDIVCVGFVVCSFIHSVQNGVDGDGLAQDEPADFAVVRRRALQKPPAAGRGIPPTRAQDRT